MNISFKELYFKYKQNGIEKIPNGGWQHRAWLASCFGFSNPYILQSAETTTATDKGET